MIFLAIELSGAMPAPRNPLQAKGAVAWQNAKAEGGLRPVNRLLVHAVDDKTNVVYERAVRRFLGEVRRHGFPFHNHAARDETMARHLEQLCYVDEKGFHEGSNCFFGFLHIFGDHKDRMPLSARALQAWSRLIQQAEGMPLCRESIGAIALQMLRQGRLHAACITLLSFDGWLRQQDWNGLRREDVVAERGGATALFFGVRTRGEKSKTGTNQGLVLQIPLVSELLKVLGDGLAPQELIFPLSASQFREQWWLTLKELAMEWAGPPHNLRHSGAACFVESGGALEQARRRGRWASPGSVQRYTKTHFLVRHRARVPPPLLAEGSQFWRSPARSFVKALRMGAAADTYLGKQLVKGIDVNKVDRGESIKGKNKRDFNEGQNDFIDGKSDFINDVGKIFKRKGEGDFVVTDDSSCHGAINGDAVHSQEHPGPEVEPLPPGPVAGLKREMHRTTGDVHEPPSTETQGRQGSIRKKRAARARGAAPVRG